jgi:5,10-methenyltetrahydrofolate synthetase
MDNDRQPDIRDPKSHWRAWANRLDRSGASDAVVEHLAAWPPFHGIVAIYLPMRSEISLDALLMDTSIAPVIPRIERTGNMTMRSYDPNRLVRHRLGFDEPDDASIVVDPADIDIVLVPGLVFDMSGGRLGRGKGYYDHFLASLPRSMARIGVTTDASVVECVPTDDHDQRVGWLATESGVRWVGGAVSSDTERFMNRAIEVGIAPNIERFPAGTRTSQDAAMAVGCELGAIAKSLVFMVDDDPVLVICAGDRRVDEIKLASFFGAVEARPASRTMVHDVTGYEAGGTPGVGHDTRLGAVVDTALGRYRRVWSAGGTPDTVYEVKLERLVAASGARWAEVSTDGTR